jgi:predicted metal-dependent HD superfamily phosphohydrolase
MNADWLTANPEHFTEWERRGPGEIDIARIGISRQGRRVDSLREYFAGSRLFVSMKSRFLMWCIAAGADGDSAGLLWLDLGSRYSEHGRHYHTLDHLAASLTHLDAIGLNAAIEGAIWFHDVIYDPTRGDNEEQSAAFFRETTAGWIDPAFADRIHRLIVATDLKAPREEDPEVDLMVDIDWAILGAEAAEYDAYAAAIRREYAHVAEEDFRKARGKILRGLLATPLYRTEAFRNREANARANILRELEA